MMLRRMFTLILAALGLLASPVVLAQPFPSKPIRIVVAFAPGGATDVLARALAQQMSTQTGATVIVENKPGASGAIAMELVARAPADGYTLLWGSDTVIVQPLLRKNFPVDPMKDFTPLARLGTAPIVVTVHKGVPARDIKELVALAKSKPGGLRYGSGGNGSTQHLSGEEFKIRSGIDMLHVPYRGTGPAITDALGGHIDVVLSGIGEIAAHAASGDLRPLGLMSEVRAAALPNVPTFIESGFPGFVAGSWMGVLGPAGLPRDVALWLTERIAAAAQSEDFSKRAQGFGMSVTVLKGAETAAFMRALSERFREAIDKNGITAE